VELNRAVAVSTAFGPAAGLDLVGALTAYHRSWRTTYSPPSAVTSSGRSGGSKTALRSWREPPR
jgi:predicted RNA polymerase sigma factor